MADTRSVPALPQHTALVIFIKSGARKPLDSRIVSVQAITLLARAHRQLGPGLADMVRSDVKPVQLAAIEEAFAANPLQAVRLGPAHGRGNPATATVQRVRLL